MDILKKYYNLLINPINFPFGKEVENININKEKNPITITKTFRKTKMDKYIKAIYLSNKLKKYDFVPKLIKFNDNKLELEQIYCGSQATIATLPNNWKKQLIKIKHELIKEKVSFIDWGPWDVNPFVINNLCINNEKIYLIDLGDCEFTDSIYIEKYFDLQIYYIEQLIKNNRLFIMSFYIINIYKGLYRKISRLNNWMYFIILYIAYYA